MKIQHNTWAVVLAGGEGTRLRSMTIDSTGQPIPKQFCSLFGRSTLLEDALRRAHTVAERKRLCAVVAVQHEQWWQGATWRLAGENVIAQPDSRGTAIGILLPLLTILKRDPDCRILFLPADHFLSNETSFACAMLSAVIQAGRRADDILLLGIEPDEPDPEFGYIVPGETAGDVRRVIRFVEKPRVIQAEGLIGAGALWNSFIFAARGVTLLKLFRERMPTVVHEMVAALQHNVTTRAPSNELRALYERLPNLDFCRDVLPGAESRLRVIAVPGCGWTDLGTPRRIADVVDRSEPRVITERRARVPDPTAPLNLSAQYQRPVRREVPGVEARP